MQLPQEFYDIITACTEKWADDSRKAAKLAWRRVKKLENYQELVDQLVRDAIQQKVNDMRHTIKYEQLRVIRDPANDDGRKKEPVNRDNIPSPKVVVGRGKAAASVARQAYDLMFAGKTLGNIFRHELDGIATSERNKSNGHMKNAALAEALQSMVPDNKKVRDAVSERKLRTVIRRVYGRLEIDAA